MPHDVITAANMPAPTGPFAPAILARGGAILSISGQIADGSDDGVVDPDPEAQARQCLLNLDALLKSAGASKTDVVKIIVFLTDINDRAAVGRARAEYFGEHRPASTLVEVSALVAPEYRIEIDATAVVEG